MIDERTSEFRVEALIDLGRHREAADLATRALTEFPDNPNLHASLARAKLGLGDAEGAQAAARAVVRLLPDQEWGYLLCSIALADLGRPRAALDLAREGVQVAPTSWHAHYQVAIVADGLERFEEEALAAAEEAVALAPDEADAHVALGLALQRRMHSAEAAHAYRRALALDPTHVAALHNLTVLNGKNLRQSVRAYSAAVRLEPGDPDVLARLDDVVGKICGRTYWFGIAILIVALATTSGGAGPTGTLVVLALTTVAATYVGSLLVAFPRGLRSYLLRRVIRSPYFAGAALVATLPSLVATTIVAASTLSRPVNTPQLMVLLVVGSLTMAAWWLIRLLLRAFPDR